MAGSWDFGGSSGTGGPSPWDDTPSTPAPATDPWGDRGPATSPSGTDGAGSALGAGGAVAAGGAVGAPVVWLALALALAGVSLAVGVLTSSVPVAALAWFVGGPLAIGAIAYYVHRDTVQRANPWYAASDLADWGRRLVVVVSLAAVAVNAWTIADHVARGGLS